MSIETELNKIICKKAGANLETFELTEYLNDGWITESDVYNAVKTLIRRYVRP